MTDVFDPARLDAIRSRQAREIAENIVGVEAFPGGIIHDAATIQDVRDFTDKIASAIARATAATRAETIEECAKVVDTAGDGAAQDAYWAVAEKDLDKEGRRLSDMNTAREIASAIRALGGKQ